jgi:hypothetical protein
MTPTTPYKRSQQQFASRLRHAVSASQGRGRLFRRVHRAATPRTFAERLRTSLEHR